MQHNKQVWLIIKFWTIIIQFTINNPIYLISWKPLEHQILMLHLKFNFLHLWSRILLINQLLCQWLYQLHKQIQQIFLINHKVHQVVLRFQAVHHQCFKPSIILCQMELFLNHHKLHTILIQHLQFLKFFL